MLMGLKRWGGEIYYKMPDPVLSHVLFQYDASGASCIWTPYAIESGMHINEKRSRKNWITSGGTGSCFLRCFDILPFDAIVADVFSGFVEQVGELKHRQRAR